MIESVLYSNVSILSRLARIIDSSGELQYKNVLVIDSTVKFSIEAGRGVDSSVETVVQSRY